MEYILAGIIAGSISSFFDHKHYSSTQKKIKYLEKRIRTFENLMEFSNKRIDRSQDILHEYREFFEIEISKIYDKLEKQKGDL